jgi:hypothetical protein
VTAIVTLVSLALCLVTLQSPPQEQVGARDRYFIKPPTEEIIALPEKLLSFLQYGLFFFFLGIKDFTVALDLNIL